MDAGKVRGMNWKAGRRGWAAGLAVGALAVCGCGSGATGGGGSTPVTLTVTLGTSSVAVGQDGTPAVVTVAISKAEGTPTVAVSGLPAGLSGSFAVVDGGPSGTLTLAGSSTVPSGVYPVTVAVTLGSETVTASLAVTSAVVAKVLDSTATTEGVDGRLEEAMSTNFQIANYTAGFFGTGATTTNRENTLDSLAPQHIRLQPVSDGVPMVANNGTASDWDFTLLDQTVQPVLVSADKSPELQIATAPTWMEDPSTGYLDVTNHLNDFATYAANLVMYYNKGGFEYGGKHFQSASATPIKWWGIFNEPNGHGLSASDYATVYNAVVPAMQAVDPTLKFSALEFSDYGLYSGGSGDPSVYLPAFLAGVTARVDVVSTHLYGTCNQLSTDSDLFGEVPGFVENLQYFTQNLGIGSTAGTAQVWVTENNVNGDYADAKGMSVCNPGQTWVLDKRATDAFFAAWRPYVFSQLGKAGNRALYHWEYTGGPQYDEVDLSGGGTYLSYWVDKALENFYPATGASPYENILGLKATDTTTVETLATKSINGTVTVMVVDRAIDAASDNDGAGDARTVVVDTSALGSFHSASLMTIDAATNAATGPSGVGIPAAARINVVLPGYGVAFLTLTP